MKKLKKGDTVVVITGNDKGCVGKILRVIPKNNTLVVSGVNIKTHFNKPRGMTPGSIEKKEAPLPYCKVALLNPELIKDNPVKLDSLKGNIVKVGFKIDENNKKVRISKKTQEVIS